MASPLAISTAIEELLTCRPNVKRDDVFAYIDRYNTLSDIAVLCVALALYTEYHKTTDELLKILRSGEKIQEPDTKRFRREYRAMYNALNTLEPGKSFEKESMTWYRDLCRQEGVIGSWSRGLSCVYIGNVDGVPMFKFTDV
jgi:hypothetical protein